MRRLRQSWGGYDFVLAAPTAAPFTDAAPAAAIVPSLATALAVTRINASKPRKGNKRRGEEISVLDNPQTLTATDTEGENGGEEGGTIKIRIVLQTCPSSLNLIKTKKAVPSHVIVVVVNLLLLLNQP